MLKKFSIVVPLIIIFTSMTACSSNPQQNTSTQNIKKTTYKAKPIRKVTPVVYEKRKPIPRSSFANNLSNAALGRLRSRVRYDGSYVNIAYPWGDVPANTGVCTDVVIRSYRRLGIDLQKEVHQDMTVAFNTYPNLRKWGLSRPDPNIDHRRVYNLRKFFTRKGAALPVTNNPAHYRPGDLVTWMVGPNLPHIGIVVNKRSKADPRRFMIVHNIAEGPKMEDVLFRFRLTGHYRYTPAHVRKVSQPYYVQNSARRGLSRTDAMNYGLLQAVSDQLGTSR